MFKAKKAKKIIYAHSDVKLSTISQQSSILTNAQCSTLLTVLVHKIVLKIQEASLGKHQAFLNAAGTIEVFHSRIVQATLKFASPSFTNLQQDGILINIQYIPHYPSTPRKLFSGSRSLKSYVSEAFNYKFKPS